MFCPLEQLDNSVESEALRIAQKESEKYTRPNLSKQMPNPSCDLTEKISQSISTSEISVLGDTSVDFPKISSVQDRSLFQESPSLEKDSLSLPISQCLSPQITLQLLGSPMDWRHFLCELRHFLGDDNRSDRHLEKLPLEHEISEKDSKWIALYGRLVELENKRDAIHATGVVAQSGMWIEYGKVSKRKFRQAYYRSQTAIFAAKRQSDLENSGCEMVKRQYIGEENSEDVKAAAAAIDRRNELEKIDKEIKLIEAKLI